jgi:hypothetical protein
VFTQRVVRAVSRLEPTDSGPDNARDPVRLDRRTGLPPGLLDGLVGRAEREQRETIVASHVPTAQDLAWVEISGGGDATIDARVSGGPAIVQRLRAGP